MAKIVITRREVLSVAVVGTIAGVLMIAFVVLGGHTFGARCERIYGNDTVEFEQCVYDLKRGKRLEHPVDKSS